MLFEQSSHLRFVNSGTGWLVVFDPDLTKPWDEKISHEDRTVDGKTIHVFFC